MTGSTLDKAKKSQSRKDPGFKSWQVKNGKLNPQQSTLDENQMFATVMRF